MIFFNNLTFTYPGSDQPAVRNINLDIKEGSFTLLIGASGSGKSTLLRCVNGLVPHFSGGILSGEITVNGLNPVIASPKVISRHVGFVFQDPESQFIVDRVEDEIAFTLENIAMQPEAMQAKVDEILELLDLKKLRNRIIDSLSGGEQQRVAIGTALSLEPSILVLDEPTSQLDPLSAQEVLLALKRLNETLGLTILISEHRIERIISFVDNLVYLQKNTAGVISGVPRKVIQKIDLAPPVAKLGMALGIEPTPISIEEKGLFTQGYKIEDIEQENTQARVNNESEIFVEIQNLQVEQGKNIILEHVDLDLRQGEILALMGPNGSGKTTLLRTIVGFIRQKDGNVYLHGKSTSGMKVAEICRHVGYLPQNPNSLLFSDSVMEELMVTLVNHHPSMDDKALESAKLEVLHTLKRIGLEDQGHAYPRDLSVGQRQRVAIGAVTITSPQILMLDEPTRGLDYAAKDSLAKLLEEWRQAGMAVLLVTHDVELAALVANRVAILDGGKIAACGDPSKILRSSETFTPQIAELFPETDWLTVQDALNGLRKI